MSRLYVLLLAGALLFSPLMIAGPISGTANTAGEVHVSGGAGTPFTGFQLFFSTVPTGSQSQRFDLTNPLTGSFNGMTQAPGIPAGPIYNLNSNNQPAGPGGFAPFLFMEFSQVVGGSLIDFYLTGIPFGSFSDAQCSADPSQALPGQNCTVAGSPFELSNTPTGVTISMNVMGYATDDNGVTRNPFTGLFSTQFSQTSFQQILQTINGGGTIEASYSAQFTVSAIPEPSTVLLTGGAFLLAGILGRKRFAK